MVRLMTVVVAVLAMLCAGCRREKTKPGPPNAAFDAETAMRTMFGNFDATTKSALSQVPAGASTSDSNFAQKDEIRVRPFFAQEVMEGGARKEYFLAWAKPAGQPFDCKGCAPLISAGVFVPAREGWKLESVTRGVLAFGDFGKAPEASVIQIGPDAHAFLLRVTSAQERTTTGEALLVPWKGTVQDALRAIVADTDEGNCGGAYPCYRNQREVKFVHGPNPQYDDIELTLSGTDMPQEPPYKLRKVSGRERLRFEDGKYVPVDKQGDTISAEAHK